MRLPEIRASRGLALTGTAIALTMALACTRGSAPAETADTIYTGGDIVTVGARADVAPLDQMFMVWSAVNRVSRGGEVIGPDQRTTPLEALKAITINAAYQYGEQASKGSLEAGKLADLVILDKNPLKVDPMMIKDIKVLETIKEDKTIFRAA